jgi:tetratricopeptide (TPR) repeat protein
MDRRHPARRPRVAEQSATARDRARLSEGRALCEQGRWSDAASVFQTLVAAGSVPALTELGLVRDELGDHAGALELFNRAMEAGDLAGYLAAGTAALADGKVDEAERLLLVGIGAGEEQWQWQLAEVFLARDDEAAAERLLRAAIVAGETRAWHDLGLLAERRGDLAEAEFAFRMGVSEGDDSDRLELARFLVRQGRGDEARPVLSELLSAGHQRALLGFAELHREQERPLEAAAAYRAALDAGLVEAREEYADLLAYDLDRSDEALEQWRLALTDGVADQASLWWEIGQAHERAGRLEAAEAAYREMLAAGDLDAHHALGSLAVERGDLVAAEGFFRAGLLAGDLDTVAPLRRLLIAAGRGDEADRLPAG